MKDWLSKTFSQGKVGELEAKIRGLESDLNLALQGYVKVKNERDEWIDLASRLHDRLEDSRNSQPNSQFSSEELKILRRLCHPDKHNNSEMSTKITVKLNSIIKG